MNKDIEPKKTETAEATRPLTPKEKAEAFAKAYDKFCQEWGYRIVVSPAFMARDDGTFSVVLNYNVGELPKEPEAKA